MTFFKRILPTLFVLILVSCTTSFSEKGSIVVTMPSVAESRAICETSDVGERTISYFIVELTSGDQLINKLPIVLPGDNAEFTSLKEGDYTVTVTAVMVVQNADGTQTEIPLYQGSDTKFVKAGYAATEFLIKLIKCPEPEKPEVSYPFYAPTLQETHFHTIITAEPAETLVFQDAFDAINENQYYQLVSSRDTDADHSLPAFTINLVTKKAGQESEVTALKEDLFVTYANYIMIVCISKTETDTVPYVLLTEYGTNLYKNNYEKFVEYIDDPEYLDFFYPTYAIQLCQYMPQIYTVLWNTYKDAEIIPFLNELSSDELINLGIAKINFTSTTKSLFIKDFYYIYAMAGETVAIPSIKSFTDFMYWNTDLSKFAYFKDKDATQKFEDSSITVSAGVTNLYVGMIGGEGEEPNPGSPEGGKTCTVKLNVRKLDFSETGDKYSSQAIDFNAVLLENNISISKGDTIVFTLSGTPDKKIDNLYYQFLYFDNGAYHDYNYSYNYGLPGISFKEGDKFTINLPINYVWAPDSEGDNPVFRAINLFYDGSNGCTVNNCEMSLTVYKSQSNTDHVIEFFKSYDDGSKEYRDECLLKHLPNMPTNSISKNHIVKVTLSAKANQDATFFVNVIDGSQAGSYFRILNGIDDDNNLTEAYGAYGFTVKEGKQTTQTLEIPITRDSYGYGDNQLQFIRELDGDPDFNNALHLENVSIIVELDYVN